MNMPIYAHTPTPAAKNCVLVLSLSHVLVLYVKGSSRSLSLSLFTVR